MGTTSDLEPAGQAAAADGQRPSSTGARATLSVLELLGVRGDMPLAELSRELRIAKSTLHRICSVLVERGWAVRDRDGRYDLGIRALSMGAHSAELPIVIGFRSVAAELLTLHDETVCLAALDGDESVFVAIEETSHRVRLVTHVGSRTAAFASASGRVILAGRADEDVAAEYGGRQLVTPTGRRLNGVSELQAILEETRRQGYAVNDEETAVGLFSASVPIVNTSGTILAALTVCVPSSRMTPDRREHILADLRAAGRRLSDHVAWLPAFTVRHPEAPATAH